MKKNALVIIDCQNDFTDPKGALFVPGAVEDNQRLSQWIISEKSGLDYVCVTLDSHQPNDIAHPNFWQDSQGNFPAPFTSITSDDVKSGKWTPRFAPQVSLRYLEQLEANGEYPHTIWPAHCLIGSWGYALDSQVFNAINTWTLDGKFYAVVPKGTNPFTEHFGAFRAQVPIPGSPETQANIDLLKTLQEYQTVYIAGQAKSHCVANSLKQALEIAPDLANRIVILEDCMSNVPGFEHIADGIYADAKARGVRFSTTTQEKLVKQAVNV